MLPKRYNHLKHQPFDRLGGAQVLDYYGQRLKWLYGLSLVSIGEERFHVGYIFARTAMNDAISILFVIRVHLTIVLMAFDVDAKLHLKDDAGSVYNVLDFVFDIGGNFCGLDSWTLLHTRLRPYPPFLVVVYPI